jgi:hypothetical protein
VCLLGTMSFVDSVEIRPISPGDLNAILSGDDSGYPEGTAEP